MAKCVFGYVNHVDAAATIIAASATAGDLAASNLANAIVGRRWRSTDLGAYLEFDFGADVSIDLVALVAPRDTMSSLGGTVRHRFDADGGTPGTGAAYDSGAVALVDSYGYHVHLPPATIAARYWRASFGATGAAYLDVGRAWAGPSFQPARNFAYGIADEWRDRSVVTEAQRSGAEYVDERDRQRVVSFALPSMTSADAATVRELQRVAGISKQILFVRDPAAPSGQTILGRLAETNPILHRALPLFSTAFTIRESL